MGDTQGLLFGSVFVMVNAFITAESLCPSCGQCNKLWKGVCTGNSSLGHHLHNQDTTKEKKNRGCNG